MISRYALDRASFARFPRNLLDDCEESTRMAERIVREIGLDGCEPPADAKDRLFWAIRAMEHIDPEG